MSYCYGDKTSANAIRSDFSVRVYATVSVTSTAYGRSRMETHRSRRRKSAIQNHTAEKCLSVFLKVWHPFLRNPPRAGTELG